MRRTARFPATRRAGVLSGAFLPAGPCAAALRALAIAVTGAVACLGGLNGAIAENASTPASPAAMSVRQTAFSDLPGWDADDHGAALDAFLRHCSPRPDVEPRHSPALCAAARAASLAPSAERGAAARRFFEDWFRPVRIRETGFLTGYFEPEFEGALVRDARHQVPLLARRPNWSPSTTPRGPTAFRKAFPLPCAPRTAR